MRRALPAIVLMIPLGRAALAADTPMSAEAFDAMTTGHTFFYTQDGAPYGVEQYLPGRKVIWAFTGDDCRKGEWYAEGEAICFVYENEPEPQCWHFTTGADGLTGQYLGEETTLLTARQSSPEPMKCMGPDVGV